MFDVAVQFYTKSAMNCGANESTPTNSSLFSNAMYTVVDKNARSTASSAKLQTYPSRTDREDDCSQLDAFYGEGLCFFHAHNVRDRADR